MNDALKKLHLYPPDTSLLGPLVGHGDYNPHFHVLRNYLLTHPSALAWSRRLQLEVWRAEVFKPI